jgi:hypothetical protein
MKIIGYADRFSVQPGETIRFMVSAQDIKTYRADIVRLIHGDTNAAATSPCGPAPTSPSRVARSSTISRASRSRR